jgi:hypothetical protein
MTDGAKLDGKVWMVVFAHRARLSGNVAAMQQECFRRMERALRRMLGTTLRMFLHHGMLEP